MSRLSLIVCTYRRPASVVRLLDAIAAQEQRPDEVLIIDGSPDDKTAKAVAALAADTPTPTYHAVGPNERGLTRQRNVGLSKAAGELIAFLDDDTVPERAYFRHILACFAAHPQAIGVGGYPINEVAWQPVQRPHERPPLGVFRQGGWERREDYRWRLRKLLGLASPAPPGWMPPSGHARPLGCLPPDGDSHRVEFLFGGASTWRREALAATRFSPYFAGYGLYEDLDFCLRIRDQGELYLCTAAHLHHLHDPAGRPASLRYGSMVVRNGWLVWRRRWPHPSHRDRLRWWAVTLLLTLCRLADALRGAGSRAALAEAMGRSWGIMTVLVHPPHDPYCGTSMSKGREARSG